MIYNYWLDIIEDLKEDNIYTTILEISFRVIEYLTKIGIKVDINDVNFNDLMKEKESS